MNFNRKMCIRDRGDEDDENSDDAVVMRVGNMMLIVTLFHGHIPDNEAEIDVYKRQAMKTVEALDGKL